MLREDVIKKISDTYAKPDPPGSQPTAYLHCSRGPVAEESEEELRKRDEQIVREALLRGALWAAAPSFVQLLGMLPLWCLAIGLLAIGVLWFINFAAAFLKNWPLQPERALASFGGVFAVFVLTMSFATREVGHIAVLLPALSALGCLGLNVARGDASWTVHRHLLEPEEARPLVVAVDRLVAPGRGLVVAAFASFAALVLFNPVAGLFALPIALRFVAAVRHPKSITAAKEAFARFLSYNLHECYAPYTWQYDAPFRTPDARHAIFSLLMMLLGCGFAAAFNP
jgi:hypothetical protein